ncbi:hypothetical protein Hhal_2051 [Halorhodospira halophila SL1]|uniref:Uncharacterized protein n=3 Tax=Pseudomonadota TaxID=1224 RepID=A1WYQ3_HALHL|nr:hypothetical protein [Halorhodospira halophila]ABM62815.1 hypothetical protein Hhal_2051 [Halorhodospira halophila SL1]MBK1728062.1 hypothetical protein [Halorhodospira halophila]
MRGSPCCRHAALLLAAALGLGGGGCALLGERYPDAAELREQGRAEAESGYTYGHGTGETPEEARQSALYEIAGEVVTAVRGEQREVFRSLQRRGEVDGGEVERATEVELTATVASVSHVALEGARVVAEQRVAGGWYVRVRLSDQRMAQLRAQARRNAPAMAQFELTEAVPEDRPGQRFARAARGLQTVTRTGVGDQRLYSHRLGETTFAAYFEETARQAAAQLQVIPVVADDEVRFVAVDRHSLRPQPNLKLRIGGMTLLTDDGGWTAGRSLRGLGDEVRVEVLGAPDQPARLPAHLCCLVSPRRDDGAGVERAALYLHTEPSGAVVRVDGRDYVTPARVPVRPGERYRVRVLETAEHRGDTATVRVDEQTPAAYFSVRLTERQYGHLDLRADGRHSLIRLVRHDHQEAGAIRRPAEAGAYTVRITRDDPDYQDIVDELVLRPDERIQRQYTEPRYRRPYHYGWRWGVTLGVLGGEPGDGYRVPGSDGNVAYGDRPDGVGELTRLERDGELNAQLGGQAQYFADRLPVTFAGGLGLRSVSYEAEGVTGEREDVDLDTLQLTLGAGLWRPLGGEGVGWLTANQAWERSRWDDDDAVNLSLPGGRSSNRYPFLELGGQWGPWLVAARVAGGDGGLRPVLLVGFGGTAMERGYELPPEVEARPGSHFD